MKFIFDTWINFQYFPTIFVFFQTGFKIWSGKNYCTIILSIGVETFWAFWLWLVFPSTSSQGVLVRLKFPWFKSFILNQVSQMAWGSCAYEKAKWRKSDLTVLFNPCTVFSVALFLLFSFSGLKSSICRDDGISLGLIFAYSL